MTALLLFSSWIATLVAQSQQDPGLSTLIATVTDRNGTVISDLGPGDFTLSDSGKEQKIVFAEQSKSRPISIGFIVDTSAAMKTQLAEFAGAIDRFSRSRGTAEEVFLVSFSSFARLDQKLTVDRDRFTAALRGMQLARGRSLYDAIQEGTKEARNSENQRKAIILIAAGQDTADRSTLNDALFAVRESDAVFYSLGVGSNMNVGVGAPSRFSQVTIPPITLPGGTRIPSSEPASRQSQDKALDSDSVDMLALERLAAAGAGRAILLKTSLDEVLVILQAELESQYVIRYKPDHPANDGKWHSVSIRTRNSRFQVRTRKEYFSPKDSKK